MPPASLMKTWARLKLVLLHCKLAVGNDSVCKRKLGILTFVVIDKSGYDGNPCNNHIDALARKVRDGVWEAGLVGYQFNTIGVSDAIPMGTAGMSFSLPSRDVIADSIETVNADTYQGELVLHEIAR